ncbi:UNVERIFIED_CONTAM: hypothetical protein Sradi_3276200 [Sesamum radiatum]|uniref:Gag-asp_proteas domain-containing protein n=1 Tax=Sesamum radiatum TaxID=300843 RepID=A0AAW2R0B1_SESRA
MKEKSPKQKGLMYVRVLINSKAVMAMVDTGATHNFVADREVQKLGLTLAHHSSRIKAVNSDAKPIQGVACVELKGMYLQDSVRATEKKDSLISALQVKNGLKWGEQTYLAAIIEIKPGVVQEVPNEVAEVHSTLALKASTSGNSGTGGDSGACPSCSIIR